MPNNIEERLSDVEKIVRDQLLPMAHDWMFAKRVAKTAGKAIAVITAAVGIVRVIIEVVVATQ